MPLQRKVAQKATHLRTAHWRLHAREGRSQHFGLHRTQRQTVDAYARVFPFFRQALREGSDGGLADAVGEQARELGTALIASHTADIEDVGFFGGLQEGAQHLQQVDGPVEVDAHDVFPVGAGGLVEGLIEQVAGIVDHYVYGAPGLYDFEQGAGIRGGDVVGEVVQVVSGFLLEFLQCGFVAGQGEDAVAIFGKLQGGIAPDAPAGPGDDDVFHIFSIL